VNTTQEGVEMSIVELREMIEKEVERAGSQNRLAKEWGMSRSYLCEVLKGSKEPGKKILDSLGIKRVTVYEKK
jgi:biotin operon repressor